MKTTPQNVQSRTDLVLESVNFAKMDGDPALSHHLYGSHGIEVSALTISDDRTAKRLEKPKGRYVTLSGYDFKKPPINFEDMVVELGKQITTLLPDRRGTVLVVGLGNEQITPDAIGPRTVRYLIATRHLPTALLHSIGLHGKPVCAIAPGVLGQTGMEACEITASVNQTVHPSCIIAIDALAAADASRLGVTVQLCDSGISPGSGVQGARKELSKQTLGCPVIAIGVPTVIDLPNDQGLPLMVTPREVDTLTEHAAKVIGFAINHALHPALSLEEIAGLVV